MEKIKGLIKPAEAKKLDNAYTKRCELVGRDILKKPDNRSSWWSIEDLEKYLAYAKKQAAGLGYKLNGIRVYAGAHEEYGYTTFFMVPTADIPDGKGGTGGGFSDIPEGDGLNDGQSGFPPGANYPQ